MRKGRRKRYKKRKRDSAFLVAEFWVCVTVCVSNQNKGMKPVWQTYPLIDPSFLPVPAISSSNPIQSPGLMPIAPMYCTVPKAHRLETETLCPTVRPVLSKGMLSFSDTVVKMLDGWHDLWDRFLVTGTIDFFCLMVDAGRGSFSNVQGTADDSRPMRLVLFVNICCE